MVNLGMFENKKEYQLYRVQKDLLIDLTIITYVKRTIITNIEDFEYLKNNDPSATRYILEIGLDSAPSYLQAFFPCADSLNETFDKLNAVRYD